MIHGALRSKFPAQTIDPSASIAEAAQLMCEQGMSALVVVDQCSGVPLYTITDRDFVFVTAAGIDPLVTTLEQFMMHPRVSNPPECWFG